MSEISLSIMESTHALAKRPDIATDDNITGPRRAKRLFPMRGLMNNLLGRVTPDERTWIPRMTLASWENER